MLCFHNGILAADIVRTLDAQYNSSLAASEYPGDPKCKVVWRRGLIEGKYTNAGLTIAYWIRTIPHCHEGTKDEFSCPFCRTMAPAGVSTCSLLASYLARMRVVLLPKLQTAWPWMNTLLSGYRQPPSPPPRMMKNTHGD